MGNLLTTFKQIRDDLSNAIDKWELQEGGGNLIEMNRAAFRNIRKWLNYLRQFYDDEWIATKIGAQARELKRWETGKHLPLLKNRQALKALYDEERRRRKHGRQSQS